MRPLELSNRWTVVSGLAVTREDEQRRTSASTASDVIADAFRAESSRDAVIQKEEAGFRFVVTQN